MVLDKILSNKRKEVELLKRHVSLRQIEKAVFRKKSQKIRSLSKELRKKENEPHLICEMKKASPSEGIIRKQFCPMEILSQFEKGGASAVSVLTDTKYFMGSVDTMKKISPLAQLPLLRKDFIIDEYQVFESKLIGADAILLIVSIISEKKLRRLIKLAHSLQLETLVEIHNRRDLDQAFAVGAKIVGINNRNLNTLTINLQCALNLILQIPRDILKVVESGIETREDILRYRSQLVDAFLVGTTLMKSKNMIQTIQELKGK